MNNEKILRPRPMLRRMADVERRERNERRTLRLAGVVVLLCCFAIAYTLVAAVIAHLGL